MPNVENLQEAVGMTTYEKLAIMLSAVAILIPIIQWIWKKWIMKESVQFFPTGQAMLFFNQSGSYIRIYGVLESKNKATTIKKIRIVISRMRDDRKLNLAWSHIISPVNQSMLGRFVQTTEAAHPFRVEADSVACAFIEYCDPSDSSGIKIRNICSNLNPYIQGIVSNHNFVEALELFSKSPEFLDARNQVAPDMFWEVGKYTVDVYVEYGKRKTKAFPLEFSVTEQNYIDFQKNISEALLASLKNCYNTPCDFKTPTVEVSERKV